VPLGPKVIEDLTAWKEQREKSAVPVKRVKPEEPVRMGQLGHLDLLGREVKEEEKVHLGPLA
jgi:hypothetical protein